MNFEFEYLREIDFIIETKLEYESREQMVFFYQQSKSYASVPVNMVLY
jgi:hypothetical protein